MKRIVLGTAEHTGWIYFKCETMGYILELTHSSLFWGIFEGFLLNLAVAWIGFDTILV
jgi:hypothetical protein